MYQESISSNIWSLNQKQRQIFDILHEWARDHIKYLSSPGKKQAPSFYILISGGAGVGNTFNQNDSNGSQQTFIVWKWKSRQT